MPAIAGIERQFFEFGPGQQPVAAEMLDEKIRGVATDPDAVRGKGVADHRGEVARAVGIAADRGGAGRFVEGAAQRRAAGQIAGLGDNEGVAHGGGRGTGRTAAPARRRPRAPG